jgi:tetratricopeptide (TPR) repeat protein
MTSTRSYRLSLTFLFASSLLVCIEVVDASSRAAFAGPQDPPTATGELARGISLYDKGNYQGAIDLLQSILKQQKNDLSAWHYLGLSLEKLGQAGKARQAHAMAAKLADALVQSAIKKQSDYVPSLRERSPELIQAADSAARLLKLLQPTDEDFNEWTERSRSLGELAELVKAEGRDAKVYTAKEVTTKAQVLDVPEPNFAPDPTGRDAPPETLDRVMLRGIFTADGKVQGLFVLRGAYHGFALACIKAAHKIRFIPAIKDGQPVAMYMTFEFNYVGN